MIKSLFAVYDSKAKIFCTPFPSINTSTALRDFAYASNQPDSDLHKYPLDYNLCYIGNYDDDTGLLTSCQPVFLGMANDFIDKPVLTGQDGVNENA